MAQSVSARKTIRKNFGKVQTKAEMPNLIQVQKQSYDQFLQMGVRPEKREMAGLQEVLSSVFPIKDFSDKAQLEFVEYHFEKPKYDVEECQQRGLTFAAPLRLTLRLVVWDVEADTGARSIRDIKEQNVYVGDIPLMTENGTFIVNGSERVIVSQMHRSPGVFFDHDEGKTHSSGKYLFASRIIPYRGSWLDFEFDAKDILNVRIDRRRKLPVTTLLRALEGEKVAALRAAKEKKGVELSTQEIEGMSSQEILNYFYGRVVYEHTPKGWKVPFIPDNWKGVRLGLDLVDAESGKLYAEKGTKLIVRQVKKFESEGLKTVLLPLEDLVSRYVAEDLFDKATGEVIAEAGAEITPALMEKILENKITKIPTLAIDHVNVGAYLRNTLASDKNTNREEALMDIYRVMRPGEPPTLESAHALFQGLFFDVERYDLSAVGRVKMNARLDMKVDENYRILRKEDILAIVKVLLGLKDGVGQIDDIDHLGNRRVRSVGELLENQFRVGLLRMERSIRERMGSVEIDSVMPHDLINAKPLSAAVREFFGTSQLSQFMDQTNPLSEITHKRRLSALGPGGLSRERAGFEVRDVHPTHYGRICPIETPEGPNIGLINSLCTYAKVNQYGFIETPYWVVKDGKVTSELVHLTAMEETKHLIAQATAHMDKSGKFLDAHLTCRGVNGEYFNVTPAEVTLMEVSPKQMVSAAASLIPFLENDDANRALMGSNMQRQAVPLLRTEAPLVGTGMEGTIAKDSGAPLVARRDGVVSQLDGHRIVVRVTEKTDHTESGVDIYHLRKFQRSNQDTCINQKALVKSGDVVRRGDILADGPATANGELALGQNFLVAFMSWGGCNFEDSIIISERVVGEDRGTSIHIEEFEVMARDTKLGNEEITRDIPNVGDEALRHLDEAGIVHIGAHVNPGDILVGKVTPKGESPMTPEEKLLRAIFGEKASDVRDTSLRLPPGTTGTIVDVRSFTRRGVDKDERSLAIEQAEIQRLNKDREAERMILEESFYDRLKVLLLGQKINKAPDAKAGADVTEDYLGALPRGKWRQVVVADDKVMQAVESLKNQNDESIAALQERFEDKVEKVKRGDELLPGVMKMVKVFVAVKRKLQPGDKMAGRHGNKGVISRIVPVEDMPHLEDGRPVDIILNPLGVPSRMNVGQILETHLGWASAGLGAKVGEILDQAKDRKAAAKDVRTFLETVYVDPESKDALKAVQDESLMDMSRYLRRGIPVATPVFDGASEADIVEQLTKAGLDASGQVTLVDGRTGESFDRQVTVGYIYMLKLHHLVDDKIHARSIGPYSLVTQQPLGGKAQFGGQRFGEMEVWALEAYGAAYTLQEMLTVKSDDVAGRTKVYESIVRGDTNFESGVPESFNVLIKELRSLCLNVDMIQAED